MKTNKNIFEKITAKIANTMIDQDAREWPPTCSFFAYQPVHPTVRMQETAEEAKNEQA